MRIRHFGLLANRVRAVNLAICRRLLAATMLTLSAVTAVAPPSCPVCGRGHFVAGARLSPQQLSAILQRLDSS